MHSSYCAILQGLTGAEGERLCFFCGNGRPLFHKEAILEQAEILIVIFYHQILKKQGDSLWKN
ncbi:hypothetical protein H9X85_11505 [Anaerotignum lactatifermentans]|uniref:Uncharacterized protein n=1 Tax=Anaerotignum lactatifermentans TaxID=160404 RepID=A0ABS2GB83_9FIRM|nr:hypothetical protein [Anaerotignum lactatifermentans]MBM6830207.1 hypothetical protein [Anaerotignum lactatifermentans]MBM6878756.1 hypothetical protein [Anaerotignum lactatifermentans]MBM6951820.1 hypothetical protein [Anaerotignum lactatifermentans]